MYYLNVYYTESLPQTLYKRNMLKKTYRLYQITMFYNNTNYKERP